MACYRGHAHLIVFAHACGYYSRAATISFTELQVRLLFEGGYQSRAAFIRGNTVYGTLDEAVQYMGQQDIQEW